MSNSLNRELRPLLEPAHRRRLILEGIELFNTGRYYECHEAWETVWRSTTPEPRDLFQGLIQVGVGLYHHHDRGRPDVAHRVLGKGQRRLETLASPCLGLDLEHLLRHVVAWRRWLASPDGDPPPAPRVRVVHPRALC
ncbi:MAG: DUF309 domain-containing protein [Acidobacteriota bacterium]